MPKKGAAPATDATAPVPPAPELTPYFFPSLGTSILAATQEEADGLAARLAADQAK